MSAASPAIAAVAPLVRLDNDAVVVSALKLADDESGDVIVRCYESHGGRAKARLEADFEYRDVQVCDLLERPLTEGGPAHVVDGAVELDLRPFQLVTLRFACRCMRAAVSGDALA